MITSVSDTPVSSLRQRMIEDMNLRRFARKTQFDYVRHVARFATYLGRPPDTATAEDLRLFQVEGLGVPTMNSIVSALRFFFTHTIDRPDLSRKLHTVKNVSVGWRPQIRRLRRSVADLAASSKA
jgi:hypothetical protein